MSNDANSESNGGDEMCTGPENTSAGRCENPDNETKNEVLDRLGWIARMMAYSMARAHFGGHRVHAGGESGRRRGLRFADPRHGQGRVLTALQVAGQVSQKDLTFMMGMSRQAMAELLRKLEDGGYVSRTASEGDKRVMLVTLTAQGAKAAERIEDNPDRSTAMLECLNDEELDTLNGYLARIVESYESTLPAETREVVKSRRAMFERFARSIDFHHDGASLNRFDSNDVRRARSRVHGTPRNSGDPRDLQDDYHDSRRHRGPHRDR